MVRLTSVAAVALLLSFGSVQAAEKTIVLNVKNADCVLCPPIVKESLTRVPGRRVSLTLPRAARHAGITAAPSVATSAISRVTPNVRGSSVM